MMYRSNLSWFLAMTVIVGISSASVLYDFEGGGPGFTVNGNATVHNGSMRLTENAGSLSGSVIFDPISTAPVTGFEASFDFRALNADGADGMSFALLNSSFYGPTAVFGEAGPGANSLSIGIDLYDNGGEPQVGGNYFDIRLNGTVIASATPSFTMEGTGWHHVAISFNSGYLTLVVTPEGGQAETLFDAVRVLGFAPFVGRFGFGARTGGSFNEHRIDNAVISTPQDATNPSPRIGATEVPWNVTLGWDAPEIALGEDEVYRVILRAGAPGDSNDIIYVTEPAYTPAEPLSVDTQYFWRIDRVDVSGTEPNVTSRGNWWFFRTKGITPKITVNPSNVSVWPGEIASFTCEAQSDTPLAYQWYKGGTAITGETSNVLTIADAQDSDAGDYYCVATNQHGSTQSETASLKIKHLLAWYPMDDQLSDENRTVVDASGNGNHGTSQGGVTSAAGIIGGALDFNGQQNSWVNTGKMPSALGIDGNKPRSISAWVYTRGFGNGGIFDMGTRATAQDFSLRTLDNIDNRWRIQYWDGDYDFTTTGAGNGKNVGSYEAPTLNSWAHFVHTHDGARTRIWLNGRLIVDWAKTINTTDGFSFRIGMYGNPDATFNGLIDDVRVYDFALDATEVAMLYTDVMLGEMVCVGGNPAMDFNGDCRVGIEDLALLVSEWLECNLVPDCKP
jgi:hypothetical protein